MTRKLWDVVADANRSCLITDATWSLYIGADNTTGELINIDKIKSILEWNGIDGATFIPCAGLWKGEQEPSWEVTLVTDRGTVVRVAKAIASAYAQQAVGLVRVSPEPMEMIA